MDQGIRDRLERAVAVHVRALLAQGWMTFAAERHMIRSIEITDLVAEIQRAIAYAGPVMRLDLLGGSTVENVGYLVREAAITAMIAWSWQATPRDLRIATEYAVRHIVYPNRRDAALRPNLVTTLYAVFADLREIGPDTSAETP